MGNSVMWDRTRLSLTFILNAVSSSKANAVANRLHNSWGLLPSARCLLPNIAQQDTQEFFKLLLDRLEEQLARSTNKVNKISD